MPLRSASVAMYHIETVAKEPNMKNRSTKSSLAIAAFAVTLASSVTSHATVTQTQTSLSFTSIAQSPAPSAIDISAPQTETAIKIADRRHARRGDRQRARRHYRHKRQNYRSHRSNFHRPDRQRGYPSSYRSNLGISFSFGTPGYSRYRWAPAAYSFYKPTYGSRAHYRSRTTCRRVNVQGRHYGHSRLISVKQCTNPWTGSYIVQGSERLVY